MTAHDCCAADPLPRRGRVREGAEPPAAPRRRSHHLLRRAFAALGWLFPAALLALFPKCPACLAAWVAAATGLGLSFTTAGYLRILLGVACVAALLYWAVRVVRIIRRQRHEAQASA